MKTKALIIQVLFFQQFFANQFHATENRTPSGNTSKQAKQSKSSQNEPEAHPIKAHTSLDPAIKKLSVDQGRLLVGGGTELRWSESSSWDGGSLPSASDQITEIKASWNMLLDLSPPVLKHLKIFGRLSFDAAVASLELKANIIEIMPGGELVVGDIGSGFPGSAKIILHGDFNSPKVAIASGFTDARKALINRGSLSLHGKSDRAPTAGLLETVSSGSVIKVDTSALNWEVGDMLVLPSSTTDASQAELVKIKGIAGNSISLESQVAHVHTAYGIFQSGGQKMATGTLVLNLTKNVSIEGEGSSLGCTLLSPAYTSAQSVAIRGEFHLTHVQFKSCGQQNGSYGAFHVQGNVDASKLNVLENCSFLQGLGKVVWLRSASNMLIKSNSMFSYLDSGIELDSSRRVQVDSNHLASATTIKIAGPGDPVELNYGIRYINEESLEQSETVIRNNRVSSVANLGVAYSVPGQACDVTHADASEYNFYNNLAHSCDFGWLPVQQSSNNGSPSCLKFLNFKAFKIKLVGLGYSGSTAELQFENLLISDSKDALIVRVESAESSIRKVSVRDSVIAGRSMSGEADVYKGSSECESNGIKTPFFIASTFEGNPIYEDVNILRYTQDNLSGQLSLENVTFSQFQPDPLCSATSFALRVNDLYQGSPVDVVVSTLTFDQTHSSHRFQFPSQSKHPNNLFYCAKQDCLGLKNSMIFDSQGSLTGSQRPLILLNQTRELSTDPHCTLNSQLGTFDCEPVFGQLLISGEGDVNEGDLFPARVTVEEWETGDTPQTFQSTANGLANAGAQVRLQRVNILQLNKDLHTPVGLQMISSSPFDWAIVKIRLAGSKSVRISQNDRRVEALLTDSGAQALLVHTSDCGAHFFDHATSSLLMVITSTATCLLEVNVASTIRSSLELDLSREDFTAGQGVQAVTDFIYKSLSIAATTGRVSLTHLSRSSAEVYFEIEASGGESDPAKIASELEELYCSLSEQIKRDPHISGWPVRNNLGLARVTIRGEPASSLLPSCNSDPHQDFPCVSWKSDFEKCLECGSLFERNQSTGLCEPENCQSKDSRGKCTVCKSGFWLDKAYFHSCKSRSTFPNCERFFEDQDKCQFCKESMYLTENGCQPVQNTIENCKYYSDNGQCRQCQDSFGLESNKCEEGAVLGCLVYSSKLVCEQCQPSFYFADDACHQYASWLRCKSFNPSKNECVDCASDSLLSSKKACQKLSECAGFDTLGTDCQICVDNFYLDSSAGVCRPVSIPFCQTPHTNTNQCRVCENGYWLDSSKKQCVAVTPVDGCSEYRPSRDECLVCAAEKVMLGKVCMDQGLFVSKCADYSDHGMCRKCQETYLLFENTCIGGFPGCLRLSSKSTCSECLPTYFLNSSGTCGLYSDNLGCKTLKSDQNACSVCEDHHRLNEDTGKCEKVLHCKQFEQDSSKCQECDADYFLDQDTKLCNSRTAQHCRAVDDQLDQCSECVDFFFLSEKECVPVSDVPGCLLYHGDRDECRICYVHRFLRGSSCVEVTRKIDNCKIYDSAQNCQACNDYFYWSGDSCLPGELASCKIYASKTQCAQCEDGYYIQSGQCRAYSTDLNCAQFSVNSDRCVTCPQYRKLDTSGKCRVFSECKIFDEATQDKCQTCHLDYYLDSDSGNCKQRTAQFCAQVQSTRDECLTCQPGHWMDSTRSNLCKPVTQVSNCHSYKTELDACDFCISGKFLSSKNVCADITQTVEKCRFYQNDGVCQICQHDHYLSANQCLPGNILGCMQYRDQSTCARCYEPYYLQDSRLCQPYSAHLNCQTYHSDRDECSSCPAYFALDHQSVCVQIEDCVSWTEDLRKCRQCRDTHFLHLNLGLCVLRQHQNCATVHIDRDQCKTCKNGHWMDRADSDLCKVLTPVSQCNQFAIFENKCVACQPGTYLFQNGCSAVNSTIPNCVRYQASDVCNKCRDGFYLDGNQCVLNEVNNCAFNESIEKCLRCESGFYVDSDGKCQGYSADLECTNFDPRADSCAECPGETLLTPDNKCKHVRGCVEAPENCASCLPDFLFNASTRECLPRTAQNCSSYAEKEDKCQTCSELFWKDKDNSGVCKYRRNVQNCAMFASDRDECTGCLAGSSLIGGSCRTLSMRVTSCARYSSNGVCQDCDSAFSLEQNKCESTITHCRSVNLGGNCSACDEGYYLESPLECRRYSFHRHCVRLSQSEDRCEECSDYYELNADKVCVPTARCAEFDDDSQACQMCKSGFVLFMGTGECRTQMVPECLIWDPSTEQCQKCRPQFLLRDSQCKEPSASSLLVLMIALAVILGVIALVLAVLLCRAKQFSASSNEIASKDLDSFNTPVIVKDPSLVSSWKRLSAKNQEVQMAPNKLIEKDKFEYNSEIYSEKIGKSKQEPETGNFETSEFNAIQLAEDAQSAKKIQSIDAKTRINQRIKSNIEKQTQQGAGPQNALGQGQQHVSEPAKFIKDIHLRDNIQGKQGVKN